MKLSLAFIATSFLASTATVTAKNMLRKGGNQEAQPLNDHHDDDDRKLSHTLDISSNTAVVDLCGFYANHGSYTPLPVTVTNAEPDKVYRIQNAAGIKFTFSTCGTTPSARSTISVWNEFNQGDGKYVALSHDDCGINESTLEYTAPDNSAYYVNFTSFDAGAYNVNA